jgi:Tfp pilus assembly protein PilN
MADIDMIPRSYREGLRVRRTLAAYGAALAVLLVVGAGASLLLRWRVAVETPKLERMRSDSALAGALRTQLGSAQQRKDALAGEVEALALLRGAGEAASLARMLEATLNERVWIEQLRFTRTEEALRDPLPSPLPPGAVRTTPAPGAVPAQGAAPAWQLGSHIELSGQALDHRAMTDFLGALSQHPLLSGVRFLNSSEAPAEAGGAVTFGATGSLVKRKEAP